MTEYDLSEYSHRRYNPLIDSWILCSPHRAKRPWLGQKEIPTEDKRVEYDPNCYLCPGNMRVSGIQNPIYKDTYAFVNDFQAVKADQPEYYEETGSLCYGIEDENDKNIASELFKISGNRGECRVICFSPKHNKSMAELSVNEIQIIIKEWIKQYNELGSKNYINYVQIFENKGEMMGCSNPHPHGQIWALEQIPEEPFKELKSMTNYETKNGRCLLCDYIKLELKDKRRIVCENELFVVLVPFWAIWPYETILLPKIHLNSFNDIKTPEQQEKLAEILKNITSRYDNMFNCSFPYSMGWHQNPTDGKTYDKNVHIHCHFYPCLLRSSTVKKFLVGFEMLGEPQRDLTAEQAAEKLRNLMPIHYKENN